MNNNTKPLIPTSNKILASLVILLSCLAAYLCIRWAIADILKTQVNYQLNKAQGVGITAQQWQDAENMLQTAMKLHLDNADTMILAIWFYQTATNQSQILLNELGWQQTQQITLDYTRRALQIRPSSPYLWDQLFVSKTELEQFDDKLAQVMQRTLVMGPWESAVQYDIAFIGMDHWDKLSPAAQQVVLTAAEKTLVIEKKNEYPLFKDLQEQTNINKICNAAGTMAKALDNLNRFCQSLNNKIP